MLVPWASFSWITTNAPARITTAGRIQISGTPDHRERAGTAAGRSSKSGFVGSLMPRRIPQKSLVERPRREQRQDHHGGEGPSAPADDDRREGLDLHQCGQQRNGVNIGHRMPSDEFYHSKQLTTLQTAAWR